MRASVWTAVLIAACATCTWAAAPRAQPAAAVTDEMERYERNSALGEALSARPGKPEELKELQTLADNGLKRARELVAKYPDSAEASYLLGTWLIYGYRVVEETRASVDEEGLEHAMTVQTVVQGLRDDCQEGLDALKRTTVLEPGRGKYLVDYGAALFDCGQSAQARDLLRAAWFGQPQLTVAEKTQAGILLSRIYLQDLKPQEAREWAYSGLAARPENVPAMQKLRELDAAEREQVGAAAEGAGQVGGEERAGPEEKAER
jgi:hypothetical protein